VAVFEKPPATRREVEEEERGREAERERERGARGRWKAVEEGARERDEGGLDGEAMLDEGEEEDLDGEPMEEEDVDGEPMLEDEDEAEEPVKEMHAGPAIGFQMAAPGAEAAKKDNVPPARRRRPKAEDMFADLDAE